MRDYIYDVQRPPPYGDIESPVILPLSLDRLHPCWRIAHRDTVRHHLGERIILDYELVLIIRGEGRFRLRNQCFPMMPHTVLMIPPFTPHEFLPNTVTGNDHIAIHFDLASDFPGPFEEVAKRAPYRVQLSDGLAFPTHVRIDANGEIDRLFHQILHARISTLPWQSAEISRHLLGILLGLLQMTYKENAADREPRNEITAARVARIATYMRNHIDKPLSLAELETCSGFGRARLISVFRTYTGQTPQVYLKRMRVEHARMLLANLSLSIKEVAIQCGYPDAFAFSKMFRSVQGMAPTEYRETLLRTNLSAHKE